MFYQVVVIVTKKEKIEGNRNTTDNDRKQTRGKKLCVFAGGMPGSLPTSQPELQGPCWGWRVQASPLPQPAYWSMLGKKEEGGEGEGWCGRNTPREKEGIRERAGD